MTDPIVIKFKIAARHEMSHQRLSYEDLGKRVGVSRQHLHYLLNKSQGISLSAAVRIAKALRKTLEEMTK